ALAAHTDRLRGVAVVEPSIDAAMLDRFHANGVRAVRLNLRGVRDLATFGAASWTGLFERIAARGWHLEALVEGGRVPDLMAALEEAPVALVLDHFGNPEATLDGAATFAAAARRARS